MSPLVGGILWNCLEKAKRSASTKNPFGFVADETKEILLIHKTGLLL